MRELQARLEDYSRRRAQGAGWSRRFVPTGLQLLDAALPHGGLPCGAITEILSDGPGVGVMSLVMRIVSPVPPVGNRCHTDQCHTNPPVGNRCHTDRCQTGGAEEQCHTSSPTGDQFHTDDRSIVVIDARGDFYPPAVCRYGLSLDRLVVIRPRGVKDAFWAADQALRCSAVSVVVAPLSGLDERLSRRLQLAAESSGCLGLVLRPARGRVKSFAAVQMLVEGGGCSCEHEAGRLETDASRPDAATGDHAYLCRITLLKVREGVPGGPMTVDLHDETGALSIPSVPFDRSVAKLA